MSDAERFEVGDRVRWKNLRELVPYAKNLTTLGSFGELLHNLKMSHGNGPFTVIRVLSVGEHPLSGEHRIEEFGHPQFLVLWAGGGSSSINDEVLGMWVTKLPPLLG